VPAKPLDPLDLYAVRNLLTDDERMVQESVARVVDAVVADLTGPGDHG
jgi:glutaryl-CoA dehydrogenase